MTDLEHKLVQQVALIPVENWSKYSDPYITSFVTTLKGIDIQLFENSIYLKGVRIELSRKYRGLFKDISKHFDIKVKNEYQNQVEGILNDIKQKWIK
jgi:hypothetical protein